VIFAAITKRAQIPFSSWLPAAIAAPTPVSALVHSSTLVTAGVYLLIRFNFLFFDTIFRKILLLISGLTMFIAGLGANFEFDLKKIIALSTLSQLGLIISTLSLGLFKLAFFHLLTHALFKALLFICAGAVIHNIKNSQDIRDIGSLLFNMPFTISCLNVANLALCGLPFLAGFYSKDLILESVLTLNLNFFSLFLFFFSTGLTVIYSFRLFYFSIIININYSSINIVSDLSLIIGKRMSGLLIFAIVGGSFLNWIIFPFSFMLSLPLFMKLLTLIICFLGGSFGILISNINFFTFNKSLRFYFFSYFFSSIWFMPMISTFGVNFFPINLGLKILKSLDQGWVEYLGVQQVFNYFIYFSKISQRFQLNNLRVYFSFFVF
jgi:NADH-ubiquinone oxidoreductase chain 5